MSGFAFTITHVILPECRLPFYQILPRLPTEIWEHIIDWIAVRSSMGNKTLHTCLLVCRSWFHRARLHLYRNIEIWYYHIPALQNTLRNNPRLSTTTKIRVFCGSNSISSLFTITRLRNLQYLELHNLDLTKGNTMIMRGLLPRSVTRLELWCLLPCTVSCLLRFLNSFHSLTSLVATHEMSQSLVDNGQVLPPTRPISSRSLTDLTLGMVGGTTKLIEWYIGEGYFLINLKRVYLIWKDDSYFESPLSLLSHCWTTLEDLTLCINTKLHRDQIVDEFSNTSMS